MAAKIVVVGSFNSDLVTYVEHLPAPGETILGRNFTRGPGGKGSNQAVGAARLAADVSFVGRVGKDEFAGIGYRVWQDAGVDTTYVTEDPDNATGIATIFVDDHGENMIVVASGANFAVLPPDVDHAVAALDEADVLLIQLEVPLDTVEYALKTARKRRVITILNPAPAANLSDALLLEADYITPNEGELRVLSGVTDGTIEQAARQLMKREDQTIVVTLGAQGAMWVRQGDSGTVPAFPVDVVDAVGAGDAFNAGLAVALARGDAIEVAVRFASAAAGLTTTKPGASSAMPTLSEVQALLA